MDPVLLGILIVTAIIFNIGYIYAIYGNIFLKNSPKHTFNHAKWMSKLNAKTQLKDIVFPGSHDSLIFDPIKFKHKYEDMDQSAKTFQTVSFVPGINYKVNRWTQTQNSTILDQLRSGIRAFDFRVAEKDNVCYGFHTFLGPPLKPSLEDIKIFLEQNPKEVILLTIRTKADSCKQRLYDELDDKIWYYNPSDNLKTLTLEDLWERNKNIIISDWDTSRIIVSDWLNSYDEEEKTDYIESHLKKQHKKDHEDNNIFYNLEWTLTPQTTQVLFNYDSLLYKSYKFNEKLPLFLENLSEKLKSQINIISIDNSASFDLYKLIEQTFLSRRRLSGGAKD